MTNYALLKKELWPGRMAQMEPDTQILRRIAAHDEAALRELYAAFGQRMFAYAVRLTGDEQIAEDVVQDALVAIWQNAAARYRGEGRVIAWLLGIIHNLALKSLRKSTLPITDEMEEELASPGESLEGQVLASDQSRWVRDGLSQLSPEHQAALDLVFYQGLSLEEAAQVCGCPVGTVKSRLSYARSHLRGVLSRQIKEIK